MGFPVTFVGSVLFLTVATAIALLGFYCAGWRRDAAVLGWLTGGAVVLYNALKYAIQRLRAEPFFGIAPESYAFPSGQAEVCDFEVASPTLTLNGNRPGK